MTGLLAAKQNLSLKRMTTHMLGAAKFNADTYRQLRDDPSTTLQSIIIVPITGLCYGIGIGLNGFFVAGFSVNETVLVIMLSLISASIIAIIWYSTTFLLIAKLFNRSIGYSSLARPFLFSWSPGLFFVLLLSPNLFVSEGFRILATAWVGVASIFAMRHAGGLTLQQSMMTFIMSILVLVFAQTVFESLLLPVFT
jgi:hypothetical protein